MPIGDSYSKSVSYVEDRIINSFVLYKRPPHFAPHYEFWTPTFIVHNLDGGMNLESQATIRLKTAYMYTMYYIFPIHTDTLTESERTMGRYAGV